jgi:hypothetical protein
MKEESIELKLRLRKGASLYSHLLKNLKSCEEPDSEIVKFSKVFKKICALLSMPKKQVWELLHFLHDMNMITIITNHGIKINYDWSVKKNG